MSGAPALSPEHTVYAAADGLLAQRGRSFHWARRLLGAQHAERATRLYGFCRHADDVADEAGDVVQARALLAAVRRDLQHGISDDAVTADMLRLMCECRIDPAVPIELLLGVESDLNGVLISDMEGLLHYCYRVAGTVGLMMTAALDVKTPEALPHAIDLGVAMQLTNICRDVRDDALMGRRYLPATLTGDIDPSELIEPAPAVRSIAVNAMRVLLDTAELHYASGERGMHHLPAGARAGILVAARCYRRIGTVLRERAFDCWSSRAGVSTGRKVLITVGALADAAGMRQQGAWSGPGLVGRTLSTSHPTGPGRRETAVVD